MHVAAVPGEGRDLAARGRPEFHPAMVRTRVAGVGGHWTAEPRRPDERRPFVRATSRSSSPSCTPRLMRDPSIRNGWTGNPRNRPKSPLIATTRLVARPITLGRENVPIVRPPAPTSIVEACAPDRRAPRAPPRARDAAGMRSYVTPSATARSAPRHRGGARRHTPKPPAPRRSPGTPRQRSRLLDRPVRRPYRRDARGERPCVREDWCMTYIGVGRRFVALLIDGLITGLAWVPFAETSSVDGVYSIGWEGMDFRRARGDHPRLLRAPRGLLRRHHRQGRRGDQGPASGRYAASGSAPRRSATSRGSSMRSRT